MVVSRRGVLLVVHEDDEVVCLLREVFAQHGFAVEDAATLAKVVRRLDAGGVGAILVGWGTELGREVHRWVFEHHRELLHHVILLVDQVPDDPIALTCRACKLDDVDGLIDAAVSTISNGRPRMLLVDDDPALLGEMAVFLETLDFDVITASGGKAALELLQHAVFDVVLCDWSMPVISGQHVHHWVAEHRPELLSKLVFITGGDLDAVYDGEVRPMVVPKGMDSPTLLGFLQQAMGSSARFAHGTSPVNVRNVDVRNVDVRSPVMVPRKRTPTPPPPVELPEPDDDGIPIEIVAG